MVAISTQRVMRHLTKAEGYLELGMPEQALSELKSIGDPGPFSVPHLLMTAAALKAQGKSEEASESLRQVAKNLPKVSTQDVWKLLGKFIQKLGQAVAPDELERILGAVGLKPAALAAETPPEVTSNTTAPLADDEIRVEIPNYGSFSVKVESGQSVTITIHRPEAKPKSEPEESSEETSTEDERESE